MKIIENIKYEKINLNIFEKRIQELLQNENLKKIGLKYKMLGKTTYGYPLELLSIGEGKNEIFIIAGTHSSEIITVDFITQLIKEIPNIEEFDPNLFKINIIPIQNPEGFDISTSTLNKIIDFEKTSKEYYLRYRTDALIYNALKDLNKIIYKPNFLTQLKILITTNKNWKMLGQINSMPKIEILNNKIKNINANTNEEQQIKLLQAIEETKHYLNPKDIHDKFLLEFLQKLKQYFISQIEQDLNQITKLHQIMFQTTNIKNLKIRSKKLKQKTNKIYRLNPKGSIINHDSTGQFINLNSNQPNNPGIEIRKNNQIKYMTGTKSNLRNYYEGPVGLPCLNPNNFEYTIENQILYNLLKESYEKGTYTATLLYHGTGGMIYYKPNNENFINYNAELAQAYNEGIFKFKNEYYRKIEEESTTGYGDLLRSKFPGVLLIELSKMGGNPIGPYGDEFNIYNTINENFSGIRQLLIYIKQKIIGKTAIKK